MSRAISPLVSTSLLIMIAMTLSLLLYSWSIDWVSHETTNVGIGAILIIDIAKLKYNRTDKTLELKLYIRNIGNEPTRIQRAYIKHIGSGDTYILKTTTPIEITPGNITEVVLKTKISKEPTEGKYIIKIVSIEGDMTEFIISNIEIVD